MHAIIRSFILFVCTGMLFAVDGTAIHHFEYILPDGYIYVYDIDNNFDLVKTIRIPTLSGTRGVVASAATGMLYVSYGSDLTSGSMLKYDLIHDQVVWARDYTFPIDSMSITPDGKTIYMPSGELNPSALWKVIDGASGDVIGAIDTGGSGPHNTVVNANGTHVYMAPRSSNYLVEADAATYQILRQIGPISDINNLGVRPFTINSAETLAFMTITGFLGFEVGDIATGRILYKVPISGFSWDGSGPSAPSHGISISPNEHEVYVIDSPNSYVHVFDITGLPASPPRPVADIALVGKMLGYEQGCAYDCLKDGWVSHSRDGHFVFVGDSGDVIDARARQTVTTLPTLANTRHFIEVDFQNGVPVWAMWNRSSIGVQNTSKVPSEWVNIISSNSGKCLDVILSPETLNGTLPGAPLQQWSCSGGANQQFQFVPVQGGYMVTNRNSGLQLDVAGGPGSVQDSVPAIQWPYWGGSNQIWQLTPTLDGHFSVVPQHSGKCLDVVDIPETANGTADGTRVQQYTCWGGDNQKWLLKPIP